MAQNTLIYWIGNIGIPRKGPNWIEPYNPNKTIGEVIQTLYNNRLGEGNKRIEILKHERGNIGKYDRDNSYWTHDATLLDYLNYTGLEIKDIMLIYCVI